MIAGRGYGFGRALASSGYGVGIGSVEEVIAGGAGYPVYRKWRRTLSVGELVDRALREIYEEAGINVSIQEELAEIVEPHVTGLNEEELPSAYSIDWKAFSEDIARIERLLGLFQRARDDELIVMAYLHFYH